MSRTKKYMELTLIVIGLIALWSAAVKIFQIPEYYLPAPSAFLAYLINFFQTGNLMKHIIVTMQEVLVGTAIGIGIGMLCGYLIAKSELCNHLFMPIVLIMQISPKISIAPLFILWFGLGLQSKIALVALVVSFPIMINESTAIKQIDKDFRNMMQILKASRWQIFKKLEFPCAMNAVLSGIKVAVTQAITAAVIGEMMGAKSGLGYLLTNGSEMYDLNMILSSVFILSLIGLCLYYLFQMIEDKALSWKA